jgi:hypothetical protein
MLLSEGTQWSCDFEPWPSTTWGEIEKSAEKSRRLEASW